MATRKPAPATRLTAHLASDEGAATLVGLAFDFAMAQPVSTWIDADRVLAAIDRATDTRLIERVITEHVTPFIEREQARLSENDALVGDYLSAEMRAEMRALAAKPVQLDQALVRRIVEQDSVRHMLRSVVEETLDRFISTFKPGGSGGGLAGAVGRSAFGFARKAAGGGILGNIAGQVEDQLKRAAGTFVQNSMGSMAERTAAILSSPEMARQMGRTGVTVFDGAMKSKIADAARLSTKLDLDDILEAVPGQVRHFLSRDDVRAGMRAEIAANLELIGARSVAELFVDPEHLAATRADVVALAGPVLGAFAGTDAFKGWLKTALA